MIPITRPWYGVEEKRAAARVIDSGWVSQGPETTAFEKEFCAASGAVGAIAVTSCTTALHLALVGFGIGPGDEVIVPSFTFVATAAAVEYTGAKPVFCDVLRNTYNIDPADFEAKITKKTRAVIPVHLFGLCADMAAVNKIAKKHKLKVIEDAACAVGSRIGARWAGTLGDAGCFSFHPRKIITTGEGGMITASDRKFLKIASELRSHGATISDHARHQGAGGYVLPEFPSLGFNYRMTDIQSAVGREQLKKLEAIVERRRAAAAWYDAELADLPLTRTPFVPKGYFHTYQSYALVLDEKLDRNRIAGELERRGVATRQGTHATHTLEFYRKKYKIKAGDFPVSAMLDRQSLAIPLFPKMARAEQREVAEKLREIVADKKYRR